MIAASALIAIVLGSFFSLAKYSLDFCRFPRLRSLSEGRDGKYARVLALIEKHKQQQFSELQLGSLFFILLACFLGALYSGPLVRDSCTAALVSSIIFLFLSSCVSFIIADTVPRQIALTAPEAIAAAIVPTACVLSVPFCLPAYLSRLVTSGILKLLHIKAQEGTGMTEEELHIALEEGEKSGIVETVERSMVEGVFYLGDRPIGTFMTHRSEIQWLSITAGADKVRHLVLSNKEQRFYPVVEGSLDKIVGVAAERDLLAALIAKKWPGLKAVMHAPVFVPETMSSLKAFDAFKRSSSKFLLVMDEYGGFTGVVSLQDLIEEIVGELSNTAAEGKAIIKKADGTYTVNGSVNIDDIARVLELPALVDEHQDYHTLAGFVLNIATVIPKTGDVYSFMDYQFRVAMMDGNRIDTVQIIPPEIVTRD
ncbi:hemolysin family protein [Breznakiellaceae bacterium SP9]